MKSFIKYITEIKLLIENIEQFKQDINKSFGHIIDTNKYIPNVEDSSKLLDIINKHCFDNKLKKIKIEVNDFNKEKHTTKDEDVCIGRHWVVYDLGGKLDEESHFPYENWIEIVNHRPIPFHDFVSILTHEMIHYYDLKYGDGKNGMESNAIKLHFGEELDETDYDVHRSFFETESERIYKNFGIKIEKEYIMKENEKIDGSNVLIEEKSSETAIKFAKIMNRILHKNKDVMIKVSGEKVAVGIA